MKGGKRRGIAGAMTARFLRTLGGRLYYRSSKNIVVIIAIIVVMEKNMETTI